MLALGVSERFVESARASRLRRMLVATAIIITMLCGGAYAYWVSLPLPRTAGPSVSITSTPLQLSIGLDKTEYAVTDNLTVYFSLRNISNKTVTVTGTHGYGLGLEPLVPGIRLTTSAEGASVPVDPYELDHRFHFYFSWVESNGTVIFDTRNLVLSQEVYDIVLEPNGCLNQTLYISPTDYFGIPGQPPLTGAFQIRGFLSHIWINGIAGPTVTLETPGIAFAVN
jgi:hypothetical protein